MVIEIRISLRANERDDTETVEIIDKILNFVRALFPEMNEGRMDSPVIVTIKRIADDCN